MHASETFLWHDYETSGAEPLFDRPMQFAALRTGPDLEPVAEPISWFCTPADDVLPHPAACLIHRITPQFARLNGAIETEFAARIHAEMMRPGTCSAGFNSIRFDDQFTRQLFYRNFRDAYEREYRNGNSRWDIIDLARMCYALRPEGMSWPMRAAESASPGPSFRLEDLCQANGIPHEGAHEALSDVRATIALARKLREAQPRLYQWALGMRSPRNALQLLDPAARTPCLHTTARIPASRGCTTLELPLAVLPDRPKSVIAFDLMADPRALIEEPAETIADLVFTPTADLPEGIERLPLKLIHSNHVPMLAPMAIARHIDHARIGLDLERCERHAALLSGELDVIVPKVIAVFSRPGADGEPAGGADPDCMLYSGGFFTAHDRRQMDRILTLSPGDLAGQASSFQDPRLPLMLFRYRARNFPDSLSPAERDAWDEDRARRLVDEYEPRRLSYSGFTEAIGLERSRCHGDSKALHLLDQLEAWSEEIGLVRIARAHRQDSRPEPR